MKAKQNKFNRRKFLKSVGAAGLAPALVSAEAIAGTNEPNAAAEEQEAKLPQVPKRKLGKTGLEVPCLALGTMFNLVDNQVILRSALKYGVTYWDTAHNYGGGNSELGIGKFLEKNPEVRKDLFIVSKASRARTVEDIEERLQTSLKRMNTDYIDAYFAPHGLSNPAHLTDELKQWVESAKKRKLIRYFGFSTHSNMAKCLAGAAKVGWIDVIMTVYNFRLFGSDEMQAAIDACHKAKVGLVAMKTAGRTTSTRRGEAAEDEAGKKLMEQLQQRGFTQEQAAIKLTLDDKRISCACVGMQNVPILTANVAAVLDKTELTQADRTALKEYAAATCTGYCAGCAEICDSALDNMPYVSNIMRYLMYYNGYGDKDRARELFAQIPGEVRNRLLSTDYSLAEARCPQRLPIGELIAEAVDKLA
jgi:aryl-alcohol dehydrogenase-like predicted oxidoreductase